MRRIRSQRRRAVSGSLLLLVCSLVLTSQICHADEVDGLNVAELFPKGTAPTRSQYAVVNLYGEDKKYQLRTNGVKTKRVPISEINDVSLLRDYAIVKTDNEIIIPSWVPFALVIKNLFNSFEQSLRDPDRDHWSNIDKHLAHAQSEEERGKISQEYIEDCWYHLPAYMHNRLLLYTKQDMAKARLLSTQMYPDFRHKRIATSRLSYINRRVAAYAGLDLFRSTYIRTRLDKDDNIIVQPNHDVIKALEYTKNSRQHRRQFQDSWQKPAKESHRSYCVVLGREAVQSRIRAKKIRGEASSGIRGEDLTLKGWTRKRRRPKSGLLQEREKSQGTSKSSRRKGNEDDQNVELDRQQSFASSALREGATDDAFEEISSSFPSTPISDAHEREPSRALSHISSASSLEVDATPPIVSTSGRKAEAAEDDAPSENPDVVMSRYFGGWFKKGASQ